MPSKSCAYLSNVEPSNLVFLKTYKTEFDGIIISFMDQNVRPLEIEDKVNVDVFGFLSFAKNLFKKYGKQLLDTAIKTGLDALKAASKEVFHEVAETIGEFIGNKIANKIVKPKPVTHENLSDVKK